MSVKPIADLSVKLFADGADRDEMVRLYSDPLIQGLTTNPTLMRRFGISDYRAFALDVVAAIPDRPISFEVFADDEAEIERQAFEITAWGDQVYVKIPVTTTDGRSTAAVTRRLSERGVKLNITALMTVEQVRAVASSISPGTPCYVSLFAGRVADTGRDPSPVMAEAVAALEPYPDIELIWASARELLNIYQADAVGCDIITVTGSILAKLPTVGKDLDEYSLETVKSFYEDARASAYTL